MGVEVLRLRVKALAVGNLGFQGQRLEFRMALEGVAGLARYQRLLVESGDSAVAVRV